MKNKKHDIVLVKWIDAYHEDTGWAFGSAEELQFDKTPVWTTGFLLKQDKHGVLIAQTWYPNDVANIIGIPKGMIQSIINLGKVKENSFEPSRENSLEPSIR